MLELGTLLTFFGGVSTGAFISALILATLLSFLSKEPTEPEEKKSHENITTINTHGADSSSPKYNVDEGSMSYIAYKSSEKEGVEMNCKASKVDESDSLTSDEDKTTTVNQVSDYVLEAEAGFVSLRERKNIIKSLEHATASLKEYGDLQRSYAKSLKKISASILADSSRLDALNQPNLSFWFQSISNCLSIHACEARKTGESLLETSNDRNNEESVPADDRGADVKKTEDAICMIEHIIQKNTYIQSQNINKARYLLDEISHKLSSHKRLTKEVQKAEERLFSVVERQANEMNDARESAFSDEVTNCDTEERANSKSATLKAIVTESVEEKMKAKRHKLQYRVHELTARKEKLEKDIAASKNNTKRNIDAIVTETSLLSDEMETEIRAALRIFSKQGLVSAESFSASHGVLERNLGCETKTIAEIFERAPANFRPELLPDLADSSLILESMQRLEWVNNCSRDDEENLPNIDMTSKNSAALAAICPAFLPPITPRAFERIHSETCVWLNAFVARIYRDFSEESCTFKDWLGTRIANNLNYEWEGKPACLDQFTVSNMVFGGTPPLLIGARWVPTSAMGTALSWGKRGATEKTDLSHDVAFDTNFSYESGKFRFTLKSNVKMLNFRIPLKVEIRCASVIGKMRIGIRKEKSFLTFLEEPNTLFDVHAFVGGKFELKELKKIDAMIIDRIKSTIAKKFVWPHVKLMFELLGGFRSHSNACDNKYEETNLKQEQDAISLPPQVTKSRKGLSRFLRLRRHKASSDDVGSRRLQHKIKLENNNAQQYAESGDENDEDITVIPAAPTAKGGKGKQATESKDFGDTGSEEN